MLGVSQRVLAGKHLPAAVVTLMGDVALAKFGLQLPEVQPCIIVLEEEGRRGEKGKEEEREGGKKGSQESVLWR